MKKYLSEITAWVFQAGTAWDFWAYEESNSSFFSYDMKFLDADH
jgi:hypothetical protein